MYTPVILCGGSGTRLWPLSRTAYPKQLLPLMNEKSLLQETLLRVRYLPGAAEPLIICNEKYRFIVAEQVQALGIQNARIILEPEGRNTAPAATLAALMLKQTGKTEFMLVLPADQVLSDEAELIASIEKASALAAENYLVSLGILPSKPETGYGYIHQGEALHKGVFRARQFVEKPDVKTAQAYLASKEYLWNTGIFMAKPSAFLEEMARYAPDILEACRLCLQEVVVDLDFYRLKSALFSCCRSESVDYAVMEKSKNMAVVPLPSQWSDVGSWGAIYEVHEKDKAGNVLLGDVVADQVTDSYLRAESRLLAVEGVSDLVVIETPDAVLVTRKDHSQDVKALVSVLKANKRRELEQHLRDYRPWGFYEVLSQGPNFQAKRLVVKPGGKLSLQMHHRRSEHWVVIKGTALVTCGENQFELNENHSTFIPTGQKHRLENPGTVPVELIEVQTGSYFGEDDIVRFEDIYHRDVNAEEPKSPVEA